MALQINKTVHKSGLSMNGCYIMLVPHLVTGQATVPTDRNIWANKADADANPTKGTIPSLDEIADAYYIANNTAPADCTGADVLSKALYWINTQVKAQLLVANPTWVDGDIEIVDL